jgi:CheY-like chemotaxis protein
VACTPILALTGLVMPGDREKCLAAGANGYLSKPVKLAELMRLVKEGLALRPAADES